MELKPIAHRVDMHEGTEFGPHWLILGPDEFYGNGFTHEALYSGEQVAEMHAEIERLRGIVPEVLERLNDELCDENEVLREKLLDVAMSLKVCAWALRRGTAPELGERALELLKKHDLLGSPLRADLGLT
jgi:hypothetical protein